MSRRMFSMKIVDTDAFLDMPQSSQLLYYHLAMRADDDGFVSNPKKIMRMIGSQDDDYKVLAVKKFIIPFESGVCVIKHWLIHNLIRNDRYTPTQWIKEKEMLVIDDETKKYSLNPEYNHVIPNGNQLATQVRLGKVRLGEDNTTGDKSRVKATFTQQGAEVIKAFESVDPKNKTYYANKTQRACADFLVKEYGLEKVLSVIKVLSKANNTEHFPVITNPYDLKEKWVKLAAAFQKLKNKEVVIL